MIKNTAIISTVFINESWYQDDDKAKGIKAGTPKPLSLSWREATQQADGTYLVRAFLQQAGETAKDITDNVFSGDNMSNVFDNEEAAAEHIRSYEHCALLHGNDSYSGKMDKDSVISEEEIRTNRVKNVKPPPSNESVYTSPRRATLG
jgi:hypothetical protein